MLLAPVDPEQDLQREASGLAGRSGEPGALDFADRRASPARELEETEHRERFRRAVLRLEPRFQELLIGWLELGLSWQDLAGACGFSSADAARMAAKRAVYRVAALMGETASTPSRG